MARACLLSTIRSMAWSLQWLGAREESVFLHVAVSRRAAYPRRRSLDPSQLPRLLTCNIFSCSSDIPSSLSRLFGSWLAISFSALSCINKCFRKVVLVASTRRQTRLSRRRVCARTECHQCHQSCHGQRTPGSCTTRTRKTCESLQL